MVKSKCVSQLVLLRFCCVFIDEDSIDYISTHYVTCIIDAERASTETQQNFEIVLIGRLSN